MNFGEAFIQISLDVPQTAVSSLEKEASKAGEKAGDALVKGVDNKTNTLGKSGFDKLAATAGKAGQDAGNKLGDELSSTGDKAASKFGDKMKSGFSTLGKDISHIGSSIGVGLTAAFSDEINLTEANNKFQRQLGLTKNEAAQLGLAAGKVFVNGLGESLDEVTDAVSDVINAVDGIREQGAPAIAAVTQQVLGVAKAFDQDVAGTARSVGQLLRTGLAKDATEALDLIAGGLQKIPGSAEDLLDTFTEYSVQFKKLGLDGKDALGLIDQLVQGGARNTDLAADAIKEFSIRIVDGSNASSEALKDLGLDADQLIKNFGEGGPKARAAFGEVVKAINSMEDPLKRNEVGVNLFGTQFEDLGDAFRKADLATVNDRLGDLAGTADRVGQQDFGEKFRSNLEKVQGVVGLLGGALGISLGASFTAALDLQAANTKLASQLGLAKPEADQLGKEIGKVYASGIGDSMVEVSDAVGEVAKAFPELKKQGVEALTDIAGGALLISQKFDQDIGATSQAVGKLLKTGLAKDGTEALDLITVGLKNIPGATDDLIDTIGEYSVQFQKLGLSGADSLGLINQLMQGGARDADLAADAIKEFSIRAVDGSKTTADALKGLGLNADAMAASFAKGGPAARESFGLVIDKLNAIEDPLKRNQLGVSLFGTQWEDLGAAFQKADLDTAAAGLGKIEGANKGIIANDPKIVIEQFTRAIEVAFIETLGNKVVPVLTDVAKHINEHQALYKGLAVTAGVLAAAYGVVTAAMAAQAAGGFVAFITSVVTSTKLWTAGQWLLNAALAANPVGLVVAAIVALIAIIVTAYQKNEWFRNLVDTAWKAIKTAIAATADWFVKTCWPAIKTALDAAGTAFNWLWKNVIQPVWEGIKTVINAWWTWAQTVFNAIKAAVELVGKGFEAFGTLLKTVWDAIKTVITTAWTGIKIIFDAVVAFLKDTFGPAFTVFQTVVKTVFDIIHSLIDIWWKAVQIIWNAVISFLATTFKAAWDTFSALVKTTWEAIKTVISTAWDGIKIIWEAIITFIKTTFNEAWQWLWKTCIEPVWNGIKTVISTAWNWIRDTVFTPAMNFIKGPVSDNWQALKTKINEVWEAVKALLKAGWDWIVANVWVPVASYFTGTLQPAWEKLKAFITLTWDEIKNKLKEGWDWIKTNVFDPISNFITKDIPDAFTKGVNAVKTAWEKLKDAAKVPVDFMVKTVINGGIIAGINWVAGKVGADTVDPVPWPPSGWATGGVLPGYTPGRDVHRFVSRTGGALDLSGGEAIMRPEWTKAVGPGYVDMMNRTARQGGMAAVRRRVQGFATGGIFGASQRFADGGILKGLISAWDAVINPVDGFHKVIGNLVGSIPGVGNLAKDIIPKAVQRLIDGALSWIGDKFDGSHDTSTSASGTPGSAGASKGTGWQWQMNVLREAFPGLAMNSGYRPGSITSSGNLSWHARGRAVDVPPRWDVFNWIKANYGSSTLELIFGPAGGGGIWHGKPHNFGAKLNAEHMDHVHWAYRKGGVFKYDNGGWFNPGQLGTNQLRSPEAVLTPAESRGLKNIGADELADLLRELIEAVKDVAPGVGGQINQVGRRLVLANRTR